MPVRAGEYRHQVRIEEPSTEKDDFGQPVGGWSTFAIRRVAIRRTPGREIREAATEHARVPTVFELRHIVGVTTKMRLILLAPTPVTADVVYDIESAIDEAGRGEKTLITTLERVGEVP